MENKELRFKGIVICPGAGVTIGKGFFFTPHEEKIPEFSVADHDIDKEVARYYKALKSSRKDLLSLQLRLKREGGSEAAAILGSHLEMTRDPLMTSCVEEGIRQERKNPEYVVKRVVGEFEEKFSKITNAFFRERLKDFQAVRRRVLRHLTTSQSLTLSQIPPRSIVFADELTLSDSAEASSECIEAIVLRQENETASSHLAIVARSRNIPLLTGVNFPNVSYLPPPQMIVDSKRGEVIFYPTPETLALYQDKRKKQKTVQAASEECSFEAATLDGHSIHLLANIEAESEIEALKKCGAKGIGLFRSEYLCLIQETFPTEDEQFAVYKRLVEAVGKFSCVIRTFDIGGDKLSAAYPSPYEQNPHLGCRALRLMLKEKTLFKAQIRAILRAGFYGNAALLLPMVSTLTELRQARELIAEAKDELRQQGIAFCANLPVGCMIEVPATALAVDLFAPESDFFSIGTNDLVQYSLAVDRNNRAMSHLYTPTHPSILRLLKHIVQEASKTKTPVSLCGEMAANPLYTALLIGLGVTSFSLCPSALLPVKKQVRSLTLEYARKLAEEALRLATAAEIDALIKTSI